MANTMAVMNTEDERLADIKMQEAETTAEYNNAYDSMAFQTDKFYDTQINATKEWEETQKQLQQENTDFTIEKIEQQKEQSHKDYIKEQSGAYADWQKQSNAYGVNAEIQAANGLANSGYSESSQVSMYNTYQNRVATARETQQQAVLNYNNAIKEAQLQNNSILAEIAYQSLQQQLELSLAGFQYKNSLLTEKMSRQLEIKSMYNNMYMSMLNQINQEKAMAENIRQFNKTHKLQNKQFKESKRQWEAEFALTQDQIAYDRAQDAAQMTANSRGSGAGGGTGPEIEIEEDETEKMTSSSKGALARNIAMKHEIVQHQKANKSNTEDTDGYVENRNQPKGIEIDGKTYEPKLLVQNGYTYDTWTQDGTKKRVVENVWIANGRYFYWDNGEDRYKELRYADGYFSPIS